MTDSIQEQVSAFMDGELEEEASELFVRRLCKDESMRDAAFSYAVIGAAMRGELGADAATLRRRITAALGDAPADSEPMMEPERGGWLPLRSVAGVGLAAAVGMVALVALQQPSTDTVGVDATTASAQPEPITYVVPPASDAAGPFAQPPVRLTNYFVNHSQYASTLGRQSIQTGLLSRQVRFEEEPAAQAKGDGDRE